jgi:hypothetical protein
MRIRARKSAERFSEEVFSERWLSQLDALVALDKASRGRQEK